LRQFFVSPLSHLPSLERWQAGSRTDGDEACDEMGMTKREMESNSSAQGVANNRNRFRERICQ
jgi:hypothetical protein